MERLGKTMLDLHKMAKGKKKKIKVSKKERMEYTTIKEKVEVLKFAASKADATLEKVNTMKRRPSINEQLKLVRECSDTRRAADDKMERYLVLDELITAADESL